MNIAVKGTLLASLVALLAAPAWAFDLKNLTDSANKAVDQAQQRASDATRNSRDAIDRASGHYAVAGDTADLVSTLSDQLGVSSGQAAGGSAALFALAQSQLPGNQFKGVTDKVSGLGALLQGSNTEGGGITSRMLSGVSSLGGVQSAFSSLGMDPQLIGRFVPIISQFLGSQGVAGTTLSALQKLWTPAG